MLGALSDVCVAPSKHASSNPPVSYLPRNAFSSVFTNTTTSLFPYSIFPEGIILFARYVLCSRVLEARGNVTACSKPCHSWSPRKINKNSFRCPLPKKCSNTPPSNRLKTRPATTSVNLIRRYVTEYANVDHGTRLRHVHSHDLPYSSPNIPS